MDVVTSAELARHLGVTPGRVHQLVADGSLPSPLRLGARTVVWPRVLIDLPPAERSGVLCLLPPADAPAPLTQMDLVGEIGVRHYHASTGPVAIVSSGQGWTGSHLSEALVVSAARAGASPLSVTWVVYSPEGHLAWNLIVRHRSPNRRLRALHQLGMIDESHTALEVVAAPTVRHHGIVRVLGRCPGLFAPGTHTSAVLRRLIEEQPTEALEVEDPVVAPVVHGLFTHAQILDQAVQDPWARREFVATTAKAAHALVGRARTIDNTMGGVPPAHDPAPPDATWITTIGPVVLTTDEVDLLRRYPPTDSNVEGWRPPVSLPPVRQMLSDFSQCAERCTGDDEALAAAFTAAAKTLALRLP